MIKIGDCDEVKLDMGIIVIGVLVNFKEKFIFIFNIGDLCIYILDNLN